MKISTDIVLILSNDTRKNYKNSPEITLNFSEKINKFLVFIKAVPGIKISDACREETQKFQKLNIPIMIVTNV